MSQKLSYENASFLFVIRRYDQALAQFDQLLRNYPKSGITDDQLQDLYRKKLATFARVKRDAEGGIKSLREDLKNKSLPEDIKQSVGDWIAAFSKWKAENQDPSKLNTNDLIVYVAKQIPANLNRRIVLGNPELLNLLRVSGLLYERLYSETDSNSLQQILYYLAMCERSLTPIQWYSLNEIYLKECVVRFPKQAFSKKCFDAYKQGMEERSWNGPMPEGIRNSIDALKDYI